MSADPDVKIHLSHCLSLGGKKHWDWSQRNICGPDWRLYWNSGPGAFVRVGGVRTELTPGMIFLMSAGTVYSSGTEREVRHFYIHFTAGGPFTGVKPGTFIFRSPELISLAKEASEAESRGSWRTAMTEKALVTLALLQIPKKDVPEPRRADPRIEEAEGILSRRFDISNRELAAKLSMSVNSFLRLFRAETGETPQNWSRQKRLENACRLLQFSSETVERIAELSGFCDRYHFSRVFKSKYGSGPAGHRRRARMLMEGGELRAGALEKESPRV